ncbi:MAG: phosphoribosylformylglycinamidine synthase I, partial [Candidatus Eisenbacteria bacterium]|nr:phosphoribosylformylglycinamidine synthase I [Candidatus Latescibacterota bacterium]MBD3301259.1 phosphoribosylformylglycinamidine synthase I [Candidatus Eisenbacteria bacterium]
SRGRAGAGGGAAGDARAGGRAGDPDRDGPRRGDARPARRGADALRHRDPGAVGAVGGEAGRLDGRRPILNGRIAVLQLPGSNCEPETARAIAAAGGRPAIVRWNEPAEHLGRFSAYVIPGGFSYQDRIRGGAVAARLPILELIGRRATEGAPVLGICNGAQVLVESGLVPGIRPGGLDLALAPNRMPGRDGYYTRWTLLGRGPAGDRCLFTRGMGERIVPIPMAHAEGRFATRDPGVAARLSEFVALSYRTPEGAPAAAFPWNPNGSPAAAAGITNAAGNVLALMPHPERALLAAQVPVALRPPGEDPGAGSDEGPGLFLFRALVAAVEA